MTNEPQINLENKFLALLTLYTDKVIDAIQIKSFYFTNSINQKLFNLLVSEYEEKGIIDVDCINNKLESSEINHYANVVSSDISLSDILQHFEEIQRELFVNYKKRLTEDIYSKYKNGKITFDNYMKKLNICPYRNHSFINCRLRHFHIEINALILVYEVVHVI